MFTKITSIAVLVRNAKTAAEWYRDKLGFEIAQTEGHWVTVKAKDSSVLLHLCGKCEEWEGDKPGGHTGIALKCDDEERTYKELKSKGVEFDVELSEFPWGGGKYAIFKDLDGNKFWM
jgi:lactoylglutathione lyase